MPGISNILNIASRSLWASQTGVEVASHNVANINTPGYVRQSLVLDPAIPTASSGLLLGNGVLVSDVRSIQNRYLDFQMYQANTLLGFRNTESGGLSSLEEIFNESDEVGLSVDLGDFFASWRELSANPESEAPRVGLAASARVLVNQFHTMSQRLENMRKDANATISDGVSQVNNLARQIANLNSQIRTTEVSGKTAGDFRSQRTALLSELAGLVDFHTFESADGQVNVMIAGGQPLVEGTNAGHLDIVGNAEGYWDVEFVSSAGNHYDITDGLEGGSIAGAIRVRDTHAVEYRDRLDAMAYQLVNSVNAQHQLGFGISGNTGDDFFTPLASADDAAALIELDAVIEADPNNIAASLSGETGDNQNAIAIADIENALLFNSGTWSFQDYYSSLVGDVGAASQAASRDASQQQALAQQVATLRESQVGVSMEEEMSNLIKYQFAYQASSRLFAAAQDMFDTLAELT